MQKFVFLLLAICGLSTAQIKSPGLCPAVEVQKDFQITQYLGEWYEIQKYPSKSEIGSKCIKTENSLLSENSFSVVRTATSTITNQPTRSEGTATVVQDGKLLVKLPKLTNSNLLILETDYESFSVVYSCSENQDGNRNELVSILTRSKYPAQALVQQARNVLIKNGISTDFLENTNQSRCPDDY